MLWCIILSFSLFPCVMLCFHVSCFCISIFVCFCFSLSVLLLFVKDWVIVCLFQCLFEFQWQNILVESILPYWDRWQCQERSWLQPVRRDFLSTCKWYPLFPKTQDIEVVNFLEVLKAESSLNSKSYKFPPNTSMNDHIHKRVCPSVYMSVCPPVSVCPAPFLLKRWIQQKGAWWST